MHCQYRNINGVDNRSSPPKRELEELRMQLILLNPSMKTIEGFLTTQVDLLKDWALSLKKLLKTL